MMGALPYLYLTRIKNGIKELVKNRRGLYMFCSLWPW